MIRNMSRTALRILAKMANAVRAENAKVTTKVVEKSLERGGVFVYRSLNPHGCPWPGSRVACARRTAGKVRRMR